MPDYKKRKIKLAPGQRANGTWQCLYRIIEIRSTCWKFHKGLSNGSFGSREEAAAAALQEAKRIIDSLELPGQASLYEPGMIGRIGRKILRRLTCLLWRSRAIVHTIKIVA